MTTFTIDAENNISAFPTPDHAEAAIGAGAQPFTSQDELANLTAEWPTARLVETWNGFAGVAPFSDLKAVKKFTTRTIAVSRIWQAIQKLAPPREDVTAAQKGAQDGTDATRSATSTTRKPMPPKAPKAAQKAKAKSGSSATKGGKATEVREGSKSAKVLAMIQRPKGATLTEIMKATGWQPHSVRGFISGALGTKMGLKIDSTKRDDGERVYSLR